MKKVIVGIISLIVIGGLVYFAVFYYQNLRGVKPVILPSPKDITELIPQTQELSPNQPLPAENQTEFPLTLPDGFMISIFAKDLPGARVIVRDGLGNFWVSQTSQGTVSLLEYGEGKVQNPQLIFKNLKKPHGLAVDPQDSLILYIAEEDKISRVRLYTEGRLEKIADLPAGSGHFTRTIRFGPDDRLYVSIGSSCNVCYESDARRAAIYSMNRDGSDFKSYATGLRNSVFFEWSYVDGRLWATDNGRDLLGDDLPPDEINIVQEGADYGWPRCYGKNVHDTDFDKKQYARNPCENKQPSFIDLQAHSAALGLVFIPEEGWPEEYWYDLIVAFHGSWNRSVPTGYKLVRIKLDSQGNYQGTQDFITGWLDEDSRALGRPVQVVAEPGGIMYVTDDKAGVIYKIVYKQ